MADIKMTQISDTHWGYYTNGLVRWYRRLQDAYRPKKVLDYDYADDVSNIFFIYCYHLKDWLRNDDSIKIKSKDIEAFVSSSTPLSICGDLANGRKHLALSGLRSKAKNLKAHPAINMTFSVGSKSNSKTSYTKTIEVDDRSYDALELAEECMKEWQSFLKANELIKNDLIR